MSTPSIRPESTVNIALIGCGAWGRNIARNLHALGYLAGVADNHAERAEQFSLEFACPALTLESIFQSPSIDAVAIASTAASHAEIAVTALHHGKAVFVEKPFALSLGDAEAIVQAAKTAQKPVMAGHLIRHHPIFQHLLQMVDSSVIGKLRHIRAVRIAPGRILDSESVLFDLCPHDLACIYALMGGATPQTLTCQAISHITHGIDDSITCQLVFANGVTASLEASWYNPVKSHSMTVIGTEAALLFDDTKPWGEKLMLYPFAISRSDKGITLPQRPPQPVTVAQKEPLREEMIAFAEAALGITPPLTDSTEALYVQRLMGLMQDAVNESRAVP